MHAPIEDDKQELILAKSISLAQIEPLSLIKLKKTGDCTLTLPESLFDMEYPGHYLRRIKSVSVTIPSIVGPYANIKCVITLTKSKVRISRMVSKGYIQNGNNDFRFEENLDPIQSVATSQTEEDKGSFELTFGYKQHYVPFAGAGLISQWKIELPQVHNQFDFDTISDVIFHITYTAKDGGTALKKAVKTAVIDTSPKIGMQILSSRHEFPSEWHNFLHPKANNDQELVMEIKSGIFPDFFKNMNVQINKIELVAQIKDDSIYEVILSPLLTTNDFLQLAKDNRFWGLYHVKKTAPESFSWNIGLWKLKMRKKGTKDYKSLDPNKIIELLMMLHYKATKKGEF